MEDGNCVQLEHLAFLNISGISSAQLSGHAISLPPEGLQLDACIHQLIIQALERSGNNKSRAARLLGISRPTLLYRLSKYGIEL